MEKEVKGICAITEISNSDFYLCRNAISSFILNNPWFSGKLILINTGNEVSNHNLNILKLIYNNFDIIYPDDSEILTKLRKKKNTHKRSSFLFTHAFKIKSEGNIFFSKTNLFMGEISSILDNDHFSIAISSNSFPDLNHTLESNLNHNLIFVPKKYISEERYKNLQKNICESRDLHDTLGESNVIKKFIKSEEIKAKILPNTTIVNSSMFDNTKYSTFIRYHEAISSLNMDTHVNSNSFNYKKIHNYWKQFNHSLNLGINDSPRKRKTNLIKVIPKSKYRARLTPTLGKFALSPTTPSYVEKEDLSKIPKENINISVCTVCNNDFAQGAQVLIYSFLKNNPWFNGDFIIFYNDAYSQLSLDNKNKISKLYSKIEFRNVDTSDYLKVFKRFKRLWRGKPQERFIPSLFTYEAFELTREYDKVLFLDSDMLITGNVSNILNIEEDVTVTPDAGKYDIHKRYRTFNGGFLLLNGDQSKHKEGLLKFGEVTNNHALADQSMMNDYFNGNVSFLNSRYNCLKRCFNDRNFYRYDKQIKIIHYVGAKPWQDKKIGREAQYSRIENLWKAYKREMLPVLSRKNKKIIVVGNSPNIMSDKVGHLIDEFDMVIRINDFKTDGFQEYTGTKVTHWVTSFSPSIDIRNTSIFDKIFTSNVSQTEKVFNNRINRILKGSASANKKLVILSDKELRDLKLSIGYSAKNKWPTSGLIAIYVALNKIHNADVYYHGFSFFKEAGKYVSHYWNETKKEEFRKHHDHSLEEKYVNRLVKEGKIKKLKY